MKKEKLMLGFFTTYTYGIKLDGNLYQMGKKIRNTEGRHLLEGASPLMQPEMKRWRKQNFVIDHF
ncbi:MAG: hypothetical protein ACLU80_01945 [Dorea sp.]